MTNSANQVTALSAVGTTHGGSPNGLPTMVAFVTCTNNDFLNAQSAAVKAVSTSEPSLTGLVSLKADPFFNPCLSAPTRGQVPTDNPNSSIALDTEAIETNGSSSNAGRGGLVPLDLDGDLKQPHARRAGTTRAIASAVVNDVRSERSASPMER